MAYLSLTKKRKKARVEVASNLFAMLKKIPLSVFPNGTTRKLVARLTHCPFSDKRYAGKLPIPILKVIYLT